MSIRGHVAARRDKFLKDETRVASVARGVATSHRRPRVGQVAASFVGTVWAGFARCAVICPRTGASPPSARGRFQGGRVPRRYWSSRTGVGGARRSGSAGVVWAAWQRTRSAGLRARSRPGNLADRWPPVGCCPSAQRPGRARRCGEVLRATPDIAINFRSPNTSFQRTSGLAYGHPCRR